MGFCTFGCQIDGLSNCVLLKPKAGTYNSLRFYLSLNGSSVQRPTDFAQCINKSIAHRIRHCISGIVGFARLYIVFLSVLKNIKCGYSFDRLDKAAQAGSQNLCLKHIH